MNRSDRKQRAPGKRGNLPALEKALLCARTAAAHKAERPVIVQVAELASFTDYFVICSARSTRHVQGVAEHIEGALRARRLKPMGVEGLREGHWVLLDFADVVVHIFYQPLRAFYDLEGLWAEAEQVEFSSAVEHSSTAGVSAPLDTEG
jgi:ribosome-associated protein